MKKTYLVTAKARGAVGHCRHLRRRGKAMANRGGRRIERAVLACLASDC